jgi:hypothetical protein
MVRAVIGWDALELAVVASAVSDCVRPRTAHRCHPIFQCHWRRTYPTENPMMRASPEVAHCSYGFGEGQRSTDVSILLPLGISGCGCIDSGCAFRSVPAAAITQAPEHPFGAIEQRRTSTSTRQHIGPMFKWSNDRREF